MIQSNNVKSLAFNQDYSCLAVGFENSYKVYNCDPFGECFSKKDDGGAGLVEMLFSTSLIAIVGLGDKPAYSSRKLKIINTKRKSVICELTFPTSVLYVKLNRKRLVVFLMDQIFIYDVSCMKLLHSIEANTGSTQANGADHIIADLSSNDGSILAFLQSNSHLPSGNIRSTSSSGKSPTNGTSLNKDTVGISITQSGSSEDSPLVHSSGTVVLFDALNIQPLNVIECHKSPLQRITISKDGKLMATASIKGTIIRVFKTSDGKKVHEFRRGSYSATISCLSFNLDGTILACSSNTGTIHFFKLTGDKLGLQYESPEPTSNLDSSTTSGDDSNTLHNDTDMPHETIMTDEENLEINRLINTQMAKSAHSSSLFSPSSTRRSAESLKKFIWNQSKQYLPSQINSILEPKRHYAYVKLPVETESIVSIVDNSCTIVTFKGDFLIYDISSVTSTHGKKVSPNSSSGSASECALIKQYRLNEDP
ncbi:hypothetical protein CANARDRAFT_7186 [[Candida] arabinofermentans NRRL YB-2248]|uniref:Autophagy-related protein 18 n=1 Tax=[Candida] arabinofermentans NRRL YB-2248 TaxID=983967 RepID=A0A1E4T234_9ASCO|nr:hypothetical protein CANARDRAFT_7186 [[Candida] arabinofermentans NRRL YB-2248]